MKDLPKGAVKFPGGALEIDLATPPQASATYARFLSILRKLRCLEERDSSTRSEARGLGGFSLVWFNLV